MFGIVGKSMFGIIFECLLECVLAVLLVFSRYYIALDHVPLAALDIKQIRLSIVAIGSHT